MTKCICGAGVKSDLAQNGFFGDRWKPVSSKQIDVHPQQQIKFGLYQMTSKMLTFSEMYANGQVIAKRECRLAGKQCSLGVIPKLGGRA